MAHQSDLTEQRAKLSAIKKALLEKRLRGEASADPSADRIPRRACHSPVRPSFSQQRLWFMDRLEPGNPAFNISAAFHLVGPLNPTALTRSFTEIVRRHEILRTVFTTEAGQPMQIVKPAEPVSLTHTDLTQAPPPNRLEQARRIVIEEARRPFDLACGPLLRGHLLKLAGAEHILLYVVHHIIADGWSMGLLARELTAHYGAFTVGQTPPPAELPIQYGDFAEWQNTWLTNGLQEPQLDYWQNQLRDVSPLPLQLDHPRPAVQTSAGAHQTVHIPPALTAQLYQLSRAENATLFMTLLAAFQALLHRYTRQNDIVVGVPVAGRSHRDLELLIGHFTNNLALRTDLSRRPPFRELLQRVCQMTLDAYANQDVPFEKLVEVLQPDRDLSSTPLFQVMFNLRNTPPVALTLPDVQVTPFEFEAGVSAFDLNVEITELADSLRCDFIYNTDLFEADTIHRMTGHFYTLLAGAAANPDEAIIELPLLTTPEKEQLLIGWNDTAVDFDLPHNIAALFEAQVKRTPAAIALIDGDRTVTYQEINQQANRLARYLQEQELGPQAIAGLYLERSPEMVIGALGVLKAGGAYLPLDPAYPPERLAFMLKDTAAPVLLTLKKFEPTLPSTQARVIFLDADAEFINRCRTENLPLAINSADPAYIIYTSGSTGKPKGVPGLHRGAVNRFAWMWQTFPFAPGEICCLKTALSFVDSVWELFGPLLQGVPSVIIPAETERDPVRLIDTLAAHAVSRIVLVPSLLQVLLDSHPNLAERLPHLKLWVVSGEALSPELARQFKTAMPHAKLLNLYGSSEAAADATWYDVDLLPADAPRVPIGRPIANMQTYILDENLQPIPIGIPGELYVGGVGLAGDYINQPELAAQSFIPHPFLASPPTEAKNDARLYKTGDIARYLPGGNIEFLGRRDFQVKIRGHRIELGEIEAVLKQYPAIKESVVVVHTDKLGDKRLNAYFATAADQPVTVGELNRFLRKKLPAYMIPGTLVELSALPLTANGKINRQALPAARPNQPDDLILPRDELESTLAEIWGAVLENPVIGVRDNFFDLGGHSLLAVRLFAEMKKSTGQSLPLATLFQSPTIEQLAARLREEGWQPPWRSLVAIQPRGAKPPFFCVHGLGGNVLNFDGLTRYLDPEQPFYGLQAVGLQPGATPHNTIEEMATHYVAEIKTVQPEGPYFLGGFCFGGAVAYEIAQQLERAGQPVALLVLIDTPLLSRAVRSQISVWQRAGRHRANLAQLSPAKKWNYARRLIKRKWQEFWEAAGLAWPRLVGKRVEHPRNPDWLTAHHANLLKNMYKNYPKLGLEIPTGSRRMWTINQLAQQYYLPHTYPGSVTLFLNENQKERFADPHLRWARLAKGGVVRYGVPGDHLALLNEPHIQVLAQRLNVCLNLTQQARAKASTQQFGQ